jgi:hypothetical protein
MGSAVVRVAATRGNYGQCRFVARRGKFDGGSEMSDREQARAWLESELGHKELGVALMDGHFVVKLLTAYAAQQLAEKEQECERLRACPYELRPDPPEQFPDSLDEVVARGVATLHVERMDANHYWMGIDLHDGTSIAVNFVTPRATIRMWAEVEHKAALGGEGR